MILSNKDFDPSKFVGFTKEYIVPRTAAVSRFNVIMDSLGLIPGKNILFSPKSRTENRLKDMGIDTDNHLQLGYWYVNNGIIYTFDKLFVHEMGHLFDSNTIQATSFDFGLLSREVTDHMFIREGTALGIEYVLAKREFMNYHEFIADIAFIMFIQNKTYASMDRSVADTLFMENRCGFDFNYVKKNLPVANECWAAYEKAITISYDDIIDALKVKVKNIID